MTPSAQINVIRSAPSMPAPGRTVIAIGSGAHGQSSAGSFKLFPYGLLLFPTRKRKSFTVGVPGRLFTSIISPLMPLS